MQQPVATTGCNPVVSLPYGLLQRLQPGCNPAAGCNSVASPGLGCILNTARQRDTDFPNYRRRVIVSVQRCFQETASPRWVKESRKPSPVTPVGERVQLLIPSLSCCSPRCSPSFEFVPASFKLSLGKLGEPWGEARGEATAWGQPDQTGRATGKAGRSPQDGRGSPGAPTP